MTWFREKRILSSLAADDADKNPDFIRVYLWLVYPREFDARVIGFKNLLGGETLLREAVGADRAHAHTVAPAATGEDELGDSPFVVVFTIDDEELVAQAKRGADAAAANGRGPVRADDLEIRDAV